RRAFDEAVKHVQGRVQFGKPLAEQQGVQWMLAESAAELQGARLLVYQAAAAKDSGQDRITLEAALAKLAATETAQRVIDRSLQLAAASQLGGDARTIPGKALTFELDASPIANLVYELDCMSGALHHCSDAAYREFWKDKLGWNADDDEALERWRALTRRYQR